MSGQLHAPLPIKSEAGYVWQDRSEIGDREVLPSPGIERPSSSQEPLSPIQLYNRECGCTHLTNIRNKSQNVGRSSATMNQQWTDRQYIQVSVAGCRLGNRRGEQPGVGTGVLL